MVRDTVYKSDEKHDPDFLIKLILGKRWVTRTSSFLSECSLNGNDVLIAPVQIMDSNNAMAERIKLRAQVSKT